ncbi:MAG TPA: universal stress protein [Gemmatimonadaceae bacterium]
MLATTAVGPADVVPPLHSAESPQRRTSRTLSQPIIVATDGTDASEAGIATARTLSRSLNAPVQLISVIQPLQSLLPSREAGAGPTPEDRSAAEERLALIREQQRRAGAEEGWTIEIKFGSPAATLTRLAKARRARVLIMGRRAHGRVDQLVGDDTVFDVIRLAETPVLVTTEAMKEAPTVVTVAVDFSDLSLAAAREALELSPGAGIAYLLHVRPRTDVLAGLATEYGTSVDRGFERMLSELDDRTGARLDTIELTGIPAREIVDFAVSSRSQLLAVGSYRRGLFRRLAGGAMALRLMRSAPCPILIVPEAVTEDVIEDEASDIVQEQAISATLDELTRRNAGRRVLFEMDNPRVGAQLLAFDYTFLAAEFDSVCGRVFIALSDDSGRSCHSTTHTLGKVTSVDVRRAADGSDHMVRMMDSCGQAMLTFW